MLFTANLLLTCSLLWTPPVRDMPPAILAIMGAQRSSLANGQLHECGISRTKRCAHARGSLCGSGLKMIVKGEDDGSWKDMAKRQRKQLKDSGLWESMRLLDWDIEDCENDFELVVRATKEMEWIVETDFDAPIRPGVGLASKIDMARTANGEPLPPDLVRRMKEICKTRNDLVHQRTVNTISDRMEFLRKWRDVLAELSLERGRANDAKNLAGFSRVLPRQPGDTFVRTELEDTPFKRMLDGTGNQTEFYSWLFGVDQLMAGIDQPSEDIQEKENEVPKKQRRRRRRGRRRPPTSSSS